MPVRLSAVAALIAAAGLHAQPPIPPAAVVEAAPAKVPTLPPGPVKAKVGELVTFEVTGEAVGYQPAFDPADVLLVRLHTDSPKALSFLAQPKRAGTFGVAFWEKGEGRGVTLLITTAAGPAPEPTPPPVPPAPPAPNPHRAALKAAFDADTGEPTAKNDLRMELAALYRQGAKLAADAKVTTTDQLRDRLKAAAADLAADRLAPDRLPGLRRTIATLLEPVLPPGVPLDADRRTAAASLFTLVAEALAW